jgi:hypothetical protein
MGEALYLLWSFIVAAHVYYAIQLALEEDDG